MCHLPCTAWQKVCTRPAGSIFTSSLCTNITPDVPIEVESVPLVTMPLPTAPAAQSPAPPTTRQSVERPNSAAAVARELPGHFLRFIAAGEQARIQFQLREQRLRPVSAWPHRATACRWRRSLRWRTRRSGGGGCRPWAAGLSSSSRNVLGSWFRSQRIFGAVKPVRAGLATMLDQLPRGRRRAVRSRRIRRPSAGRSRESPGGRLCRSCPGTPSHASGRRGRWP